jgi:hypothetical protein
MTSRRNNHSAGENHSSNHRRTKRGQNGNEFKEENEHIQGTTKMFMGGPDASFHLEVIIHSFQNDPRDLVYYSIDNCVNFAKQNDAEWIQFTDFQVANNGQVLFCFRTPGTVSMTRQHMEGIEIVVDETRLVSNREVRDMKIWTKRVYFVPKPTRGSPSPSHPLSQHIGNQNDTPFIGPQEQELVAQTQTTGNLPEITEQATPHMETTSEPTLNELISNYYKISTAFKEPTEEVKAPSLFSRCATVIKTWFTGGEAKLESFHLYSNSQFEVNHSKFKAFKNPELNFHNDAILAHSGLLNGSKFDNYVTSADNKTEEEEVKIMQKRTELYSLLTKGEIVIHQQRMIPLVDITLPHTIQLGCLNYDISKKIVVKDPITLGTLRNYCLKTTLLLKDENHQVAKNLVLSQTSSLLEGRTEFLLPIKDMLDSLLVKKEETHFRIGRKFLCMLGLLGTLYLGKERIYALSNRLKTTDLKSPTKVMLQILVNLKTKIIPPGLLKPNLHYFTPQEQACLQALRTPATRTAFLTSLAELLEGFSSPQGTPP